MKTSSKEWRDVSLGEICELKYGKSLPDGKRCGGNVPVYGSNGVVGWHNEAITMGEAIVVGRKGSVGEVNYSARPCWPIDTTYYIDYNSTKSDLRWLAYRLPALGLTELNKSTAIPGLNREDAYRQRLLLPPLNEQRRIADVLDRAEELLTKRRAALDLLDKLTQAIFLDMFGDPASILKRWPTEMLGSLLEFLTSGSRGWAEHYAESGDLFLRIQNVRHDELVLDDVAFVKAPDTAEAKRTRVCAGDVLLSITADLGRTAVVPEGLGTAFINQHLSILRTKVLNPRFLSAYLTSPSGQVQILGRNRHGVKAGLNFDDIRAFLIPLPPLPLQKTFAARIAAIDSLKQKHKQAELLTQNLFQSLQHKAFRGQL